MPIMFSHCYVPGLVSNPSKTIGNYALATNIAKSNRLEHNVRCMLRLSLLKYYQNIINNLSHEKENNASKIN
jgi:hypothetical protein